MPTPRLPAPPVRRPPRAGYARLVAASALLAGCALPALVLPRARAPFRPAAPALRGAPLYLYPAYGPAPDSARPPRALVVFFGNDVGFWRAHERLAELLSAHGYAVAGLDVRRVLNALPNGAARESVYLARVDTLITRARAALGAGDRPLVITGHSIGGELALWTAAHLRAPGRGSGGGEPDLAGVVSLSPGRRGHLRTGLSDMLGREPHGAGSFAVDSEVARLTRRTPPVPVALVRGTRDGFRRADPAIVAAGARRFVVEGQGHSLLNLRATGPVVLDALAFVLGGGAAAPAAPSR